MSKENATVRGRGIAIEYTQRTIRLIFGLFLYGLGSYMGIQANVGLAPWEAFSMGIFYKTNILYGDIVVLTGVVIIVIDFILKEKIGFGTVLNAIMLLTFAIGLILYLRCITLQQEF